MTAIVGKEVVSVLNSRSDLGRVVVKNIVDKSKKLSCLSLHSSDQRLIFCCNRAYLTQEAFEAHQCETEEGDHDPPPGINFAKVRMSMYDHQSPTYWFSRKAGAVLDPQEEDEEGGGEYVEEEEEGHQGLGGRNENTARRKRGNIVCPQCGLTIPSTNIQRHIRTCHNPQHEYECSFCTCRFEVPYGRMVHEVKNHRSQLPSNRLQLVKKKLVKPAVQIQKPTIKMSPQQQRPRPQPQQAQRAPAPKKPPTPAPVITGPNAELVAMHDQYIVKVANSEGGKARYQCTICKKFFLGTRNAQDHMNSHFGLKPYKCPLCDFNFSFRSNVVRHIKTSHTNNSDFVCPYGCGCCMQSETSLKVHVNLICTLRHQYQNQSDSTPTPKRKREGSMPALQHQQWSQQPVRRMPQVQPMTTVTTDDDVDVKPPNLKELYHPMEISQGVYKCNTCDRTIAGSGNFRDHLNIHANIRPHKCPKCYMRFTFKSNIKRHVLSAHVANGRFRCPMGCGCRMDNQHALQSHLNKCKLDFPKTMEMGEEGEEEEAEVAPKLKRERLSPPVRTMPSATYMTATTSSFPAPPPLRKILPRPPPLIPAPGVNLPQRPPQPQAHSSSKPKPPQQPTDMAPSSDPNERYRCTECGKSVSCRRNLENHKLIHLNIKPWKCLICGLHFRTMDTLKKHKRKSHAPNSQFKCSQCPCKFTQLQGLNMHVNIHHKPKSSPKVQQSPPKPIMTSQSPAQGSPTRVYKCNVCGKVLKKSIHLQNHMRIHSGEKPYKCQFCGHRFRLASTLYDHKRSSHRGGRYKCTLCTCSFATNLGLSRHGSIFHPNIVENEEKETGGNVPMEMEEEKPKPRTRPPPALRPISSGNNNTSRPYGRASTSLAVTTTMKNPGLPQQQKKGGAGQTSSSSSSVPQKKVQIKVEKGDFQCGDCGLSFPTFNSLSDHQLSHQEMPEPDHMSSPVPVFTPDMKPQRQCPICNQSIHGTKHFHKHMRGCHSGGPFRCNLCPCSFDSQGNLSRHFTLMHTTNSNKNSAHRAREQQDLSYVNYPEVNVELEEGQEGDFQMSMQEEDDQVQYQEGDGEDTEQWYNQSDVDVDMDEQQQDVYTAASSYSVNNDGGVRKRYVCPDCGKAFDKMNRYKLHITIHTNVKPYKCKFCNLRFRLPGILNTHVKKSHGAGQYKCARCPSRFTSAKGLSVHQFVFHKGGRAEREEKNRTTDQAQMQMQQEEQVMSTPPKKALPPLKPNPPIPSTSTSRPNMQPQTTTSTVRLRCHICQKTCIGTGQLQEHLQKAHTSRGNFPVASTSRGSTTTARTTQHHRRPVLQQQPEVYYDNQEEYDDDQFEFEGIPGDEGGDEYGGQDEIEYGQEEEEEMGGFYDEGKDEHQQSMPNGYSSSPHEEYDYINAEDHLEIEYSYNTANGEDETEVEDLGGYDLEITECEDSNSNDYSTNHQNDDDDEEGVEGLDIQCKGCNEVFDSRDNFVYHIEATEVEFGHTRCQYCCTQPTEDEESLNSHIEEVHPFEEIEFLEAIQM